MRKFHPMIRPFLPHLCTPILCFILLVTTTISTFAKNTVPDNDTPPPGALCKPSLNVSLNSSGLVNLQPSDIDNGSTGVLFSINPAQLTCANTAGVNIVTLTVSDGNGNTSTCSTPVTVLDNQAPSITCPANMVINLAPFACSQVVNFMVSASDNCPASLDIEQTDATGLHTGSAFPIGVTTLSFSAQDGFNTSSCSFKVTVNDYVPGNPTIVCSDNVHVSIPAPSCIVNLTPDMLLQGNYGCSNNFSIDVNNTGSNIVTAASIGSTLPFKVTNITTDNSCWGTMLVEDKMAPIIHCVTLTLGCNENNLPIITPLVDECQNYTITHSDVVEDLDCVADFSAHVIRTWTATDASGNVGQCTQWIQYTRAHLMDVLPPVDVTIECGSSYATDANGHPAPTENQNAPGLPGSPSIQGISIFPNQGFCEINTLYTDQVIPICGGSYKILRYWTVADWCLGEVTQHIQIIKIADHTPPSIVCPANLTISTGSASCAGSYQVPTGLATDLCSSLVVNAGLSGAGQVLSGNLISGLPLGNNVITLTATDACNNASSCNFTIVVEDHKKPVPVCDEITQVTLDQSGTASINAITFDDGSTDNCGIDHFRARRMPSDCQPDGTDFDEAVSFDCCDVLDTVVVVLRVFDVNGNYNDCMVQVYIDDKLPPLVVCPPDKNIYCDDGYNIWDSEQFGQPFFYDNCSYDTTYIRKWVINNCQAGTISRRWIVTDPGGNTDQCIQKINILHRSDFIVDFPEDVTFNNCDLGNAGEPIVTDNDCEQVAVSNIDLVYTQVPDACYKIVRTWTVVNWCVFDPNNTDNTTGGIVLNSQEHRYSDDGDGYFRYIQIIKVIDNVAPVIDSPCSDLTFEDFSGEDDDLTDNDPTTSCDGYASLIAHATDACSPLSAIKYHYRIYLFSVQTGTPIEGFTEDASGEYPYGKHLIKWEIEDGCGNVSYCEYTFEIVDKKKPTVTCLNGLSSNLVDMDTNGDGTPDMAMSTIWASEFLSSWDDNCTPNNQLQLFVRKTGAGTGVPVTHSVVYTCDEIGVQPVELWVVDNAGNADYCNTFIEIQDNDGLCNPMASVSGAIQTEANAPMPNVELTISQNNGTTLNAITTNSGLYEFNNLQAGFSYVVNPAYNTNQLNGITTYDLVLINKHILGSQPLGSPYKMIAADVNHSGSVTAFDMVELRKMILHISDVFPNNSSWRFVDKSYTFPDPGNPWMNDFPEAVTLNNLNGDATANFVAIKVGDVNNSAATGNLVVSQVRSNQALVFHSQDSQVAAGALCTVSFNAADFSASGFQFTLSYDPDKLEWVDVKPGALADLNQNNLGVFQEMGLITASWNGEKTGAGEQLFSMVFRAKAACRLSESVHLNSALTPAESYSQQGEMMQVSMLFDQAEAEKSALALYQNRPNPFHQSTTIGFEVPESCEGTLRILNATGSVVKQISKRFERGYNQITLQYAEMPGAGVYYYQLETPAGTLTKKMILINY